MHRYLPWLATVLAVPVAAALGLAFGPGWWLVCIAAAVLAAIGFRDSLQHRHTLLRNYPLIAHIRWLLEEIRPEIRQYLFESNTEAAPFSRRQRSLVYQRAKGTNDKVPFGTELDVEPEKEYWYPYWPRSAGAHPWE